MLPSALSGGAALYLAGRAGFLLRTIRSISAPRIVAPIVPLALLPVARVVPALAALGLLDALLIALAGYERERARDLAGILSARAGGPVSGG